MLYKDSIVYLIGNAFRVGLYISYVATAVVLTVLTVYFVLSGIALIKQSNVLKARRALTFSFVGSVMICLVSIYPFVISACRIAAHGYQAEYRLEFWLGLVAFVFSALCLVLNRIAAKKREAALKESRSA